MKNEWYNPLHITGTPRNVSRSLTVRLIPLGHHRKLSRSGMNPASLVGFYIKIKCHLQQCFYIWFLNCAFQVRTFWYHRKSEFIELLLDVFSQVIISAIHHWIYFSLCCFRFVLSQHSCTDNQELYGGWRIANKWYLWNNKCGWMFQSLWVWLSVSNQYLVLPSNKPVSTVLLALKEKE